MRIIEIEISNAILFSYKKFSIVKTEVKVYQILHSVDVEPTTCFHVIYGTRLYQWPCEYHHDFNTVVLEIVCNPPKKHTHRLLWSKNSTSPILIECDYFHILEGVCDCVTKSALRKENFTFRKLATIPPAIRSIIGSAYGNLNLIME